jgi:hypothetical protein
MKYFDHFPANYMIDFDCELPGADGNVAAFKHGFDGSPPFGLDGPLLRIRPTAGYAWLAVFAAGLRPSAGFVDAVLTTPNPDAVCVISYGAGYWIDTLTRTNRDLPLFPVRQVEIAAEMILVADYFRLAALDSHGLKWISGRLVADGLKIERVDPIRKSIICSGFDPSQCKSVEVCVNLQTGEV